jgi:hypothetical protein
LNRRGNGHCISPTPQHFLSLRRYLSYIYGRLQCSYTSLPPLSGNVEIFFTRVMLIVLSPLNISMWGVGGFYLSLMPLMVAKVTGSSSVLLGEIAIAYYCRRQLTHCLAHDGWIDPCGIGF